jgi:hypothetical protein
MQVSAADGTPLRGDLITRVILRTDLTPIPSTVEISAPATRETVAVLAEGNTIRVGADQAEYEITRVQDTPEGASQGAREVKPLKVIGLLKSCAALGRRLQRSVIREGSTWGDIYRSIGATAVIGSDFPVPVFGAFVGMYPTPEVARVLQEEGAIVFYAGGKLRFHRLGELIASPADVTWATDHTEVITSDFLEKHALPFTVATMPDGSTITSGRDASRGLVYRPRGDARIVRNMGTVLVQRRKTREALSPSFNAGMRVDIAGKPHIVITAAHVRSTSTESSGAEEFTQLWLGEVTT